AYERTQDRRHHLAVGVRGQFVADVVQERRDHVLVVAAVAVGPRGGLQRVLVPCYLVAGERVLKGLHGLQQAVRERDEVVRLLALQQLIVLARAIGHAREADGLVISRGRGARRQ